MHDWPHIKKSDRRKKRLVKKDFDKKLIRLIKQRKVLKIQKRNLPPVILDKPYQRGWVRYFVLRSDIARSEKAQFYNNLLAKINTYWRHYDKSFKRRKIRRGAYENCDASLHKLNELWPTDFHGDKLNLTDAEKDCFYLKETWNDRYDRWESKYVFAEAWRYVLVIKPYMVYAEKQADGLLEQELAQIEDQLTWNCLFPRVRKIKRSVYKYWKPEDEDVRYTNYLKNKPRYTSKEAYLDH